MIRVVLVEDHALVREGFRAILDLQDDIDVVAEAVDGVDALAVVARHRPDVVVLDIQMPRLDGLGVIERLMAHPETAPAVLVLTTFDRDDYVSERFVPGSRAFFSRTSRAPSCCMRSGPWRRETRWWRRR